MAKKTFHIDSARAGQSPNPEGETLSGDGQFTTPVRLDGGLATITVQGGWAGTLQVQQRQEGSSDAFVRATGSDISSSDSYQIEVAEGYEWRVGFPTGGHSSGSALTRITQ